MGVGQVRFLPYQDLSFINVAETSQFDQATCFHKQVDCETDRFSFQFGNSISSQINHQAHCVCAGLPVLPARCQIQGRKPYSLS